MTARRSAMAEGGGEGTSHQTLARRPDHQDPRGGGLLGRPAILRLTAGSVTDVTVAEPLLDAAGRVRCLIANKGYDANTLRARLKAAQALIPVRSNRKASIDYDVVPYKDRWRIEAAFYRLKTAAASQPATTSSPAT